MKRFPVFTKKFSDLLPWAQRKARKLFLRTAVTGMGALAIGPSLPAAGATPTTSGTSASTAIAILDRDKRSSVRKLMLQVGHRAGAVLFASHGSHSSHSSHSSHASHYSSSTGTSPTYNPPSSSPGTAETSDSNRAPKTEGPTVSRDQRGLMSEDQAQRVVVKITSIDFKPGFKASSLSGKGSTGGREMKFFLRPDTKLHKISPVETTEALGDIVRKASSLPFRIDEEVLVAWKVDPSTSQIVAVTITALE